MRIEIAASSSGEALACRLAALTNHHSSNITVDTCWQAVTLTNEKLNILYLSSCTPKILKGTNNILVVAVDATVVDAIVVAFAVVDATVVAAAVVAAAVVAAAVVAAVVAAEAVVTEDDMQALVTWLHV